MDSIDGGELIVGDSDDTHPTLEFALREWRSRFTQYELMKQVHQISRAMHSEMRSNHYHNVHGFGLLYRKKGNNYVWRGREVPLTIVNRLVSSFDDIVGDIILYKRGASTPVNAQHFPIRLSDGRYAFVLGSTQHILVEAYNSHAIRTTESDYSLVFDTWAQEHLLDYDRLPLAINGDGEQVTALNMTNPFKNRAMLVWLMENYISDTDYCRAYDDHRTDCGPRAAYCVWQNGNTVRWVNAGMDVHPKVTGFPDPPAFPDPTNMP